MDYKGYHTSEDELIKGCISRERDAQKKLYELYSPVMYPICCRYLKNPTDAEDVLVMAFTKAFQKIDQFKAEGSFEGWLKRIVINEALAQLRSQRTLLVVKELEEDDHFHQHAYNENHLETRELMEMIHQLPAGYRSVFNMYAIDGYSHKEIASQLGISESTSKSQLSRARVLLQKFLIKSQSIKYPNQHDLTA